MHRGIYGTITGLCIQRGAMYPALNLC